MNTYWIFRGHEGATEAVYCEEHSKGIQVRDGIEAYPSDAECEACLQVLKSKDESVSRLLI